MTGHGRCDGQLEEGRRRMGKVSQSQVKLYRDEEQISLRLTSNAGCYKKHGNRSDKISKMDEVGGLRLNDFVLWLWDYSNAWEGSHSIDECAELKET